MPNTSIHLSRCNILQNNKLQPTEIYKESQQTAKLEFFCDEFLKISQSRYGLSTSADSIANLLAFSRKPQMQLIVSRPKKLTFTVMVSYQ